MAAPGTLPPVAPAEGDAGPRGVVVVGDRFREFLAHRGTVAASAVLHALRDGAAPDGPVHVGQGVTMEQRAELAASTGLGPRPAARELTHKREPRNVLVSAPRAVGEGVFEADLVLDETTETLQDHITGQHVPAITLLEVARQMWTAVSEAHLLPADGPATRFVVISMGGRFDGYVFPLPAAVRYTLIARTHTGAGESFTCRVDIGHGAAGVRVDAEYRVVPEAVAAKQELLAARRALGRQRSGG